MADAIIQCQQALADSAFHPRKRDPKGRRECLSKNCGHFKRAKRMATAKGRGARRTATPAPMRGGAARLACGIAGLLLLAGCASVSGDLERYGDPAKLAAMQDALTS